MWRENSMLVGCVKQDKLHGRRESSGGGGTEREPCKHLLVRYSPCGVSALAARSLTSRR